MHALKKNFVKFLKQFLTGNRINKMKTEHQNYLCILLIFNVLLSFIFCGLVAISTPGWIEISTCNCHVIVIHIFPGNRVQSMVHSVAQPAPGLNPGLAERSRRVKSPESNVGKTEIASGPEVGSKESIVESQSPVPRVQNPESGVQSPPHPPEPLFSLNSSALRLLKIFSFSHPLFKKKFYLRALKF